MKTAAKCLAFVAGAIRDLSKLVSALMLCVPLANAQTQAQAQANSGTFATFDVPGDSGGIFPTAIDFAGVVTGYFIDAGSLIHSFVRAPNGAITVFDPPGATCSTVTQNVCSTADAINLEGVVTGGYATNCSATEPPAGCENHGFLRSPGGKYTTFDVPGQAHDFTSPTGINLAGTVTGSYLRSASEFAGFVRLANGIFTNFVVTGSTYTSPQAINAFGVIAGFYRDASGLLHGFVRSPDGKITTYDPPIAFLTNSPPVSINAEGAITGSYCSDAACDTVHGFLRSANGTMKTIDAPGNNYGTSPAGINSLGVITGSYILADFSLEHGFLWLPGGRIVTFDPPGSLYTTPTAINDRGMVVGYYCDAESVCHGFVGAPH